MVKPLLLIVPVLAAPAPAAVAPPMWVQVLPSQPGRVYGLGVAPLAGAVDAQALRQAADNGRADVIARMRANVKADTQITTTYQESRATGAAAVGSRTQTAQIGTQVQAQAADLPGLVVEETFLDRSGGSAYALAYLDLGLAQRELQARLDGVRQDLAAERLETGVRAKLVAAQALKKAHGQVVQLDDLAGLLAGGGGDPALRAEVLTTKYDLERKMVAARAALTFGLAPSPAVDLDEDVKDVVRTTVLREGMGWSDQKPMFTINLRVRTGKSTAAAPGGHGRKPWWEHQKSADFIIAQGSLSLTLVDSSGQQYESLAIVAKGVGVNEFQADSLLMADYRNKLAKAVAAWLADLGRW
jgi:hypothetical protein